MRCVVATQRASLYTMGYNGVKTHSESHIKAFMAGFRKAFPDLNCRGAADVIAEDGYAVGRWEVAVDLSPRCVDRTSIAAVVNCGGAHFRPSRGTLATKSRAPGARRLEATRARPGVRPSGEPALSFQLSSRARYRSLYRAPDTAFEAVMSSRISISSAVSSKAAAARFSSR